MGIMNSPTRVLYDVIKEWGYNHLIIKTMWVYDLIKLHM